MVSALRDSLPCFPGCLGIIGAVRMNAGDLAKKGTWGGTKCWTSITQPLRPTYQRIYPGNNLRPT